MRGSQAAKFSNQGTRAREVYGTVRMLLTLFYIDPEALAAKSESGLIYIQNATIQK